ncbi:MAG: hypothetical protein NZ853_03695 [Leptospiraceae bacterium]|nr:hypothetical protein [Leptospiraceae bacterium]MDW7975278.1 hypothetical protein [Leptospiraceae bacterium]
MFFKIVLVITVLIGVSSLKAQNIGPYIQGEKRPSTNDPSYKPSIIPFFLQRKTELAPIESYILDPNLSIENFVKREKKEELTKEEIEVLENFNYNPEYQKYYYQKYFLPQFGLEFQDKPLLPRLVYQESIWERRMTIFLLSFPISLGLTYWSYRFYKENRNYPPILSQSETFGVFFLASLISAFVVYHDENYHKSLIEYSKTLKKEKSY